MQVSFVASASVWDQGKLLTISDFNDLTARSYYPGTS
jgi:hypothetical protein